MKGADPLIYAELLSNIRQVSVITALSTPSDASTRVELLKGGNAIAVLHRGEIATSNLPRQVAPTAPLQKPALGVSEISWRLPLAIANNPRSAETLQDNEVPWSARDLKGPIELSCRDCGSVIVKKGTIKEWKDLPSENWAEMMEFWHCHKPDVPKHEQNESLHGSSDHADSGDGDPNANRGYGANTKFTASTSIGFVDSTTFLLANDDCSNIQGHEIEKRKEQGRYQPVDCSSCDKYLGRIDYQAEGVRLYKWRLSCSPLLSSQLRGSKLGSVIKNPSLSMFFASELVRLQTSQCVSRILLSPIVWKAPTSRSTGPFPPASFIASSLKFISIWVLFPGLRVCGSRELLESDSVTSLANAMDGMFGSMRKNSQSALPLPSDYTVESDLQTQLILRGLMVKLFWNQVDEKAAIALQNREDTEELSLPLEAIEKIAKSLQASAGFLPPSARKFQTWDVGLLERYERPQ